MLDLYYYIGAEAARGAAADARVGTPADAAPAAILYYMMCCTVMYYTILYYTMLCYISSTTYTVLYYIRYTTPYCTI